MKGSIGSSNKDKTSDFSGFQPENNNFRSTNSKDDDNFSHNDINGKAISSSTHDNSFNSPLVRLSKLEIVNFKQIRISRDLPALLSSKWNKDKPCKVRVQEK